MTAPPTPPLPSQVTAELRALIHAQPTPERRAAVIHTIVRECYDAVRALHPGDPDSAERSSLGLVSDAALDHEQAMHTRAHDAGAR
jgi:hypothetical protein